MCHETLSILLQFSIARCLLFHEYLIARHLPHLSWSNHSTELWDLVINLASDSNTYTISRWKLAPFILPGFPAPVILQLYQQWKSQLVISIFLYWSPHWIKQLLCVYKLFIINQHHLLCTSAWIFSYILKSVISWKFEKDGIKVNVDVYFIFLQCNGMSLPAICLRRPVALTLPNWMLHLSFWTWTKPVFYIWLLCVIHGFLMGSFICMCVKTPCSWLSPLPRLWIDYS